MSGAGISHVEKMARNQKLMEERAEQNKARRAEEKSLTYRKNTMAREMKELGRSEKILKAVDMMLNQFIEEIKGGLIVVQYTNKELVQRRKDQLNIFKETMTTLKQMTELSKSLGTEEEKGEVQNPLTVENIALFDAANDLLAKKGIQVN